MSTPEQANEAANGQSRLTAELGACPCCGDCRFAGGWQTFPEMKRGKVVGSFIAAECGYEPLPEFWKDVGRPTIYPHGGIRCRLFERKTVPNA